MKQLLKKYFTKKVEKYLWVEILENIITWFFVFMFMTLIVTIATHNEIYEMLMEVMS